MKKSSVIIFLALFLAVAMLAGCGGGGGSNNPNPTPAQGTTPTPTSGIMSTPTPGGGGESGEILYVHIDLSSYSNWKIVSMNADGQKMATLEATGANAQPAWSQDRTKIAYVKRVSGYPKIWTMNANGQNKIQLSPSGSSYFDEFPAWSPDGTKIAFSRIVNQAEKQIFIMNADGSNPTQLTTKDCDCTNPSWSPDGTKIVFSKTDDTSKQGIKAVLPGPGG
jgi:Tol biopolymer transport system component